MKLNEERRQQEEVDKEKKHRLDFILYFYCTATLYHLKYLCALELWSYCSPMGLVKVTRR